MIYLLFIYLPRAGNCRSPFVDVAVSQANHAQGHYLPDMRSRIDQDLWQNLRLEPDVPVEKIALAAVYRSFKPRSGTVESTVTVRAVHFRECLEVRGIRVGVQRYFASDPARRAHDTSGHDIYHSAMITKYHIIQFMHTTHCHAMPTHN